MPQSNRDRLRALLAGEDTAQAVEVHEAAMPSVSEEEVAPAQSSSRDRLRALLSDAAPQPAPVEAPPPQAAQAPAPQQPTPTSAYGAVPQKAAPAATPASAYAAASKPAPAEPKINYVQAKAINKKVERYKQAYYPSNQLSPGDKYFEDQKKGQAIIDEDIDRMSEMLKLRTSQAAEMSSKYLGPVVTPLVRVATAPMNAVAGTVSYAENASVDAVEDIWSGNYTKAATGLAKGVIGAPTIGAAKGVWNTTTFGELRTLKNAVQGAPIPEGERYDFYRDLYAGSLDFLASIVGDPMSALTTGTKGATKLITAIGEEIAIRADKVQEFGKLVKTIEDDLVSKGTARLAAHVQAKDDAANLIAEAMTRKTGVPRKVTDQSVRELVQAKAPHLDHIANKAGDTTIDGFHELAGYFSKDEVARSLVGVKVAPSVMKEVDKAVDIIHMAKKAEGKKVIRAVEKKKLILALGLQNRVNGKMNPLVAGVELSPRYFPNMDMIEKAVPGGVHALIDMGGLKWLGKSITLGEKAKKLAAPIVGLPVVSSIVRFAGKKAPRMVQSLLKATKEMPDKVRYINRQEYVGRLANSYQHVLDTATDLFRPYVNDEKALARMADASEDAWEYTIKDGKIKFKKGKDGKYVLRASSEDKIAALAPNEQATVRAFKENQRQIFEAEVAAGLIDEEQFVQNYIHHMYEIPPGTDTKLLAKKFRSWLGKSPFAGSRTMPTLEIAEEAYKAKIIPFKPVKDISVSFVARNFGSVKALADKHYIDEIVRAFGVIDKEADITTHMKLRGFKQHVGVSLPKEVGAHLDEFIKAHQAGAVTDNAAKQALAFYDNAVGVWKASQTYLYPAFTVRNVLSNSFNNAVMIGSAAINPRLSVHAALLQLPTETAERIATTFAKTRAGKAIGFEGAFIKDKIGGKLLYKDFGDQFVGSGLAMSTYYGAEVGVGRLARAQQVIDKIGDTGVLSRIAREESALGKAKEVVKAPISAMKTLSHSAETHAKMVNMLHHLDQGSSVKGAAEAVRKALLDYNDLTWTEKQVIRRIIPFYTFTRKNIGFHLEQGLKQPGTFLAVKKFFDHQNNHLSNLETPDYLKGQPFVSWKDSEGQDWYMQGFGLPWEDIAALVSGDVTARSGRELRDRIMSRSTPFVKYAAEASYAYDHFRSLDLEDAPTPDSITAILKRSPKRVQDFFDFRMEKRGDQLVGTVGPGAKAFVSNMYASRAVMGLLDPLLMQEPDMRKMSPQEQADYLRSEKRFNKIARAWSLLTPTPRKFDPRKVKAHKQLSRLVEQQEQMVELGVLKKSTVFNAVKPGPAPTPQVDIIDKFFQQEEEGAEDGGYETE